MKKRTVFAGLGVLLVLGLVLAVGAALDLGVPGPHGMRVEHSFGCRGPAFSGNVSGGPMWETVFDERLADLGLTEDSTIAELKAALKEQRQTMRENRPPQNATFDDMPTVPVSSGNRTCPMGRRGPMDELMFGF